MVTGLTIDDASTRDVDDAIWVVEVPDGWEVTVSIADVAGAIPIGRVDDIQARERVETKYFASGNSPMIARDMSEDHLSLWPGKRRNVLAIRLTANKTLDRWVTSLSREVLVSRAKLTYEQVPKILDDREHPHHEMLIRANTLAHALLERRRSAGALVLYDLSNGWVTTEEGFLRRIEPHHATVGYIIIQELMVFANSEVARWAVERDVPLLYRNHVARLAAPNREELMRQMDEAVRVPMLGATLDALRARAHILLERASYGATVHGHYGLNLPVYTHVTSPIRRYADLVNQRQLFAAAADSSELPYSPEEIDDTAVHINRVHEEERERTSDAMKERADKKAQRAIDARRLDGLDHKQFERVTKLEARSGDDPTEAFEEAYVTRADSDRLPLICASIVLSQAPTSPEPMRVAWRNIRQATIRALARRPQDAVSVLAQIPQLTPGWTAPKYAMKKSGTDHELSFMVEATVTLPDGTTASGIGCARQKKQAEQIAAVVLLAIHGAVEVPADLFRATATPDAAPAPSKLRPPSGDTNKDPISVLQEWCATERVTPEYTFVSEGPDHMPTVTCECSLPGTTVKGVGGSKKDAKREAAIRMLKELRA